MVICLQIPATFWIGERTTSLSYGMYIVQFSDVRWIEIHTTEPLLPDSCPFEVEIAIAKLKSYKSAGSDQIPAVPIQTGDET
jgi:hypothetical protein